MMMMMNNNISMVEAKLPPGFRFHPRDEELVCDYLMKKVSHSLNSSSTDLMIDVDLNKCEPWDIPERACVGGKEWYFYTQRDRKYATGMRTNRATASGYWKATGKDRCVLRKGKVVGMRKTLVFYQGRAPKGTKTDWVMHEFRLHPSSSSNYEDWVLCRVFYKNHENEEDNNNINNNTNMRRSSSYVVVDDDATAGGGSSSPYLPELMDSYNISFDNAHNAAAAYHHYEQVPCFSTPAHPTANPNPRSSSSSSSSLLMAPSSSSSSHNDSEVLKALLTQLTKMETHHHDDEQGLLATSFHQDHQAYLLSQQATSIPNYLWNNNNH